MSEVFYRNDKPQKDPLIELLLFNSSTTQWSPMYPDIPVINIFSRIIFFDFNSESKIAFNFTNINLSLM
tara:strand:- start:1279 stop:1485 length:207 start_codon:yes stop_codon:yes gene_type:complete